MVGVPPVGVNVIFGLTVTFLFVLSFCLFLPLARMTSFTLPALTCLALPALVEPFTPLPATVRSPGFGRLTWRVAVPLALALTLPKEKSLVGVISAVTLRRYGLSVSNMPMAPSARLPPSRNVTASGASKAQAPFPSQWEPSTSPAFTWRSAGNVFRPGTRGCGPSWATAMKVAGSPTFRKNLRPCTAGSLDAFVLHEVTVQVEIPPVDGTT